MFRRLFQFWRSRDRLLSSEERNSSSTTTSRKEQQLETLILAVAQEFEHKDRFREAAKEVASRLEFRRAKELLTYFHGKIPEPKELQNKLGQYDPFGAEWEHLCQDAIFEILFHYKEQAIPILYTP